MTLEPESLNGVVAHLEELQEAEGRGRTAASLAEAYRLQGRPEDAVRVAREAAGALPRHVAVRIALARALSDTGDTEGARRTYRDALTLDPENLEAMAALDESRSDAPAPPPVEEPEPPHAGTLSEELAHLSELFLEPRGPGQSPPEGGIATLTLAEIYARQGLLQRAIGVCEMLVERDPDDRKARERLETYRKRSADAELAGEAASAGR
ncbi:MAG: tetratricopeptide repeat protein [Candidatus Eisenbacteria bacterium]|nr:tetratricopeptide repeat protein [Candidatus Eisenbacteria bacterium]